MKVRRLVSSQMLRAIALATWLLLPPLHAAIKTEEIPDLKPPQGSLPAEAERRSLWPFVLAGAGILAGLLLLSKKPAARLVAETPYARAIRELDAQGQPEAVTISRIVHRYLIETFSAPGPGQTFEDLAALLARDSRWTPALRERLRLLVDPLEIAKFAPPGNPADLQRLRNDAKSLLADLDALHRPPVTSPA
jgi:hypothetical protein